MTDKCKATIREWMRDVHAMEIHVEYLLSKQLDKLKKYPEIRAQYEDEVRCVVDNQIRLSIRLQQLGTNSSIIKDASASFFAGTQKGSTMKINDDLLESILITHSFICSVIGSYKILKATVVIAEDDETGALCDSLLQQSEDRVKWILQVLEWRTNEYLLNLQK